ncbi:uncharacterized protein LOC141691210 [Apium graveolens]|uniref:uncharacterized protein LOC141691210 n=1 Tax=Apium graveolens TaxID=4045 RepID=UPI003D7A9A98
MTSKWITEYYENDIRMNPTWPLGAFRKKVVNDWGCEVSIYAIGRAKNKALKVIRGNNEAQYGQLWDYMGAIKKAMPDSTIELMLDSEEAGLQGRRFKRIYVCLGPLKKGFTVGCRPLIRLDGCHLKGPYGGQLLTVVGCDSNDGMYPISWAIVEVENTETWNWFLELLVQDVNVVNSGGWTFISNRQKGLVNALTTQVPNAEHRFCVMHLYMNMYKDHKGVGCRSLLWLAARATTDYMFNKHMTELQKLSKKCHSWLMEKPISQWTRSAFRTSSLSDMFVNNHCEVFNNSIREYRDLPIIGLLQGLHKSAMRRIQTRRDKMAISYALNHICPNFMRKVHKAMTMSNGCVVQWSGKRKYLVTMTDGGHEIVVDLDARTCACRKFDLTGLPCYHACACINWKNLNMVDYIHRTYSKDMYLSCYEHTLEPITSDQYWDKTGLPPPLPPVLKVQPGRPKKLRSKKNDIPLDPTKLTTHNTKMYCSYCKEGGHNARTCASKKIDQGSNAPKPKKKNKVPTSKGSKKDSASANPGAINTPTTPAPSSVDITPQHVQGYNQGGVFTSYTQPARMDNIILGIQPQKTMVRGQFVTTLQQIEAEANSRKAALSTRPPWRL